MPAGTVVAGKYRIERLLGVGGMGMVVAATHLALGQGVALKVLRSHSLSDREARRRFMREARATFALKSPHTVRLLDVDDVEPLGLVMVMELLEGTSLREIIVAQAPIPEHVAVLYVRHVCRALAEAHKKGFIHRDIKPANLFLTDFEGQPWIKVLDFGLSKVLEDDPMSAPLTAPLATLGTPRYMAPEQWSMPSSVDGRTDIYSLGAVFYQMLTGVLPFANIPTDQRAARLLIAPVPSPRTLRPEVSEGVARIVARCLRPVADERFASAEELEAALAGLGAITDAEHTAETITTARKASSSLASTLPELIEPAPSTDREPIWDIATTRKGKPQFDVNVFTGARIHQPPLLTGAPTAASGMSSSAVSSSAPFELATDVIKVAGMAGPPNPTQRALLASTLRSKDPDAAAGRRAAAEPAPAAPPPSASPAVLVNAGRTQPRVTTPRGGSSLTTFLLAVGIAFLVGVGLAFLTVMRR